MTVEEVKHIASLARLSFSSDELVAVAAEFSRIVDYVGILEKAELPDVNLANSCVLSVETCRDDVADDCLSVSQALLNAPSKNEMFFRVPRVLG